VAGQNGSFEVIDPGSRVFAEEGLYPAAVQIRNQTMGQSAVAVSLIDVLTPDQDGQFQVIQSAALSGNGSISQSGQDYNGGYNLQASGSLSWVLHTTGHNGFYETFNKTESGSLNFSIQAGGADSFSQFTLSSANLGGSGSSTINNQIAGSDLTGTFQRTENLSTTFTLSKMQNGLSANWTFQGTVSGTASETGVYPENSYSRTDTISGTSGQLRR
jgi:hypothetical protein